MKKKGKSKRAYVLVAAVERATANFVERGRQIGKHNTFLCVVTFPSKVANNSKVIILMEKMLRFFLPFSALEIPEIEPEMIQAVEEVQQSGEAMSSTAREFATDPCSSAKRGNMVRTVL